MDLTETRKRFPTKGQVLLDRLVAIIDVIRQLTVTPAPFPATRNPIEFYNGYIEFAVLLYMMKFRELYSAVATCLETQSYLVYASVGRAILENVAILRYYSNHADFIDAAAAWKSHKMKDPIIRRANKTLDRFVRGTRFTWDEFIAGKFDALAGKGPEDPRSQTNVTTCLEKWYKEDAQYRILYTLLCELVHPNMGSNMLVLRAGKSSLVAGGNGEDVCMFIAVPTLAGLTNAYKTADAAFKRFENYRLYPEAAPN